MTDDTYLAEAAAIGDRLAADAMWHQDRCNWITRVVPYHTAAAQGDAYPELVPLNPSVYSGTAGMALALGRLAHFTSDARHRRVALGALEHALSHAHDVNDGPLGALGSRWRFGHYLGTLGIAWTAVELSEILGVEQLRRDAERLLRSLVRSLDAPMDLDLMFGPASGIPVLLDLARRGLPDAADLAVALGNHLVKTAVSDDDGLSWGSRFLEGDGHNLTGYSHGTSGVAAGLAELWAATGDRAYLDTVQGALAYERSHFYPEEQNWPNFQNPVGIDGRWATTVAWCHGAAGIGLSRSLMLGLIDDPQLRDELEIAARATRPVVLEELNAPGRDTMLCHGVVGNVECLWAIDEALGRDDVVARMRTIGTDLIGRHGADARAKWGETMAYPTGVSRGEYPPLMTGVAGVLHFFLRLHDPSRVPTVLVPARPLAM